MQNRGFDEQQAAFAEQGVEFFGSAQGLIGQVRRFGEEGPAYEILRIVDGNNAWISVIYSQEELAYPISHILADPFAETVP